MMVLYDALNVAMTSNFSAVLMVVICIVCLSVFWVARWQNKKHTSEIAELSKSLKLLTSASVGMGQRLLELESSIANLRNTQEEFKHKDLDFSYTQAQKLISQGLPSDAVAANSGLSVSEVSLMELMQQESKHHDESTSPDRKFDIKSSLLQKSSMKISASENVTGEKKLQEENARSFRSSGILESV